MKSAAASFRKAARSLKIEVPAIAALTFAFQGDFGHGNRRPDLPPGCEILDPPSDQDVSFHGYAQGIQRYRFDAPTGVWVFVEPVATPDATAIPWLLLAAVSSHGPGPLDQTTYIQRTNTTGGLAPTDPGTPNQIADVPYTAQYYFDRQH